MSPPAGHVAVHAPAKRGCAGACAVVDPGRQVAMEALRRRHVHLLKQRQANEFAEILVVIGLRVFTRGGGRVVILSRRRLSTDGAQTSASVRSEPANSARCVKDVATGQASLLPTVTKVL